MQAPTGICRVAVIGTGRVSPGATLSGESMAILLSGAGFTVALEDILPGNLRRAAAQVASSRHAGGMRYAASIEDAVRDADLVLDTVPDELESKLEIFSLLDRMAPPAALFATPTLALSIADLASCTYRPGLCFGLRFGDLAANSMRIEATHAPACLPETRNRLSNCFQQLGATVTFLEDSGMLP